MSIHRQGYSDLLRRSRSNGPRDPYDDEDEDGHYYGATDNDIVMSRFTNEIDPLQPMPDTPERERDQYHYSDLASPTEEHDPHESIPWMDAEEQTRHEDAPRWAGYQDDEEPHEFANQPYSPHFQGGIENANYNVDEDYSPAQKSRALEKDDHDIFADAQPAEAYEVYDVRGYKILQGKERWAITPEPFTQTDAFNLGRLRSQRLPHFEGLRGILAFQSILWIFFRLFAPAMVTDTAFDGTRPAQFAIDAPEWMEVIRKIFSPIFFNTTLMMAMYIILIGRVSMQTFIERREAICLAGPCFRRPVRIILPVAITLAIVATLAATNGFKYAQRLADDLHNDAAIPPKEWRSVLEYLNSLFAFLFQPFAYTNSAAVEYIPGGRITWFVDVAYQQTYVLTIFCFTLPFTIFKYKSIGLVALIILSAWVDRWSWYTLTGLALAEFSVVYQQLLPGHGRMSNAPATADPKQRESMMRRLSLSSPRSYTRWLATLWSLPPTMIVIGLLFKYLWGAALPQFVNKELYAHGDAHTGKLTTNVSPSTQVYPRYDDWFLCTGILLAIELSTRLQRMLSWRPFVYLGRLGFSVALISGTCMLALGSLLHVHLVDTMMWTSPSKILAAEFFAIVPFGLVCSDIFARLFDDLALRASHELFKFARE